MDLSKLQPLKDQVDLDRVPEKKDESGWRGPCELLDISRKDNTAIVKHQSNPYIVPLRHIRPHLAKALYIFMHCAAVFFQLKIYEHTKNGPPKDHAQMKPGNFCIDSLTELIHCHLAR